MENDTLNNIETLDPRWGVSPRQLGDAFIEAMIDALDPEEIAEVREKLLQPSYSAACPTHDYIDSNVVMAEALVSISPAYSEIWESDDGDIMAATDLMNSAWDYARIRRFEVAPDPV